MHARVTITNGGTIGEESTSYVREKILPQLRSLDGFKGVIDLIDPGTGDGFTMTLWESEAAMRASEQAANAIRNNATSDLGEEIVDVKRFQVATMEV
jgi:heme-degrading monooxygenase HmoA